MFKKIIKFVIIKIQKENNKLHNKLLNIISLTCIFYTIIT